MKLISRTGQAVEIPDEHVQSAFQSGQYGLPPGAQLPMVGDDGIGYVAAQDASAAFAQGQRLAAPEEVHAAKQEARFGGVGGAAAAAALGAGRGFSFGMLDPLAIEGARALRGPESAEHVRETLAGYREANPIASTVGEVAGAVAPFVATGGASAPFEVAEGARAAGALARVGEAGGTALRAAGAIPRGVAAIGDAAGGLVARGLGEGALSRVAATATSGAIQGGIGAAGSAISDAELGNTELSGEKLLASVGHGALLGGAAGGALQATGEMGGYILGRLHPRLTGIAEEQAFRAINARKAFTTEASKVPGGVRGIGRRLLDDGVISAGDTIETIAPKVAAARDVAGVGVGKVLDAADAAGIEGPKIATIHAKIAKDVLPDLQKLGETNAGAIRKVESLMADLTSFAKAAHGLPPEAEASGLRLTFRQAQEFRSKLDDLIKWNTNPLAPVNETTVAMKGVRNAIEGELTEAGEVAAKRMGGSFRKEYEEAKLAYRQYSIADKAAQDAVERAQANAAHSLTDKLIGAHGLGAGLMHGLSVEHGGFALGGLQGLALGAIASKVSKLIRTQGNSTAAVALDRMAAIGGIRRAAAGVDRQLERGVAGLFNASERAAVLPKRTPMNYEQAVDAVSKAVGSSGAHTATVSGAVAPLAVHAPNATNAFERAALRATTFLASKIPAGHRVEGSLTPQLEKPRVTDMEKDRFLRYVQAVHDPAVVLEAMKNGSITAEHVEALRTVYPEMYGEIRQKIMARLQDAKHPLPYAMEFRVRRLFGLPGMDGKMVNLLQQNFAVPQPKGKGGAPPNLAVSKPPAHPLQDAGKFAQLAGLQQQTR